MKALIFVSILLSVLIIGCSGSTGPSEVSISLAIKYDINSHKLSMVTLDEPDKDYDNDNSVIKLRQGDTLSINLTSEIPGGFHIHGYDILNDVDTDTTINFSFVANATGKYEMVFHRFMGNDHGEHEKDEHGEHGEHEKDEHGEHGEHEKDEHEDMEVVLGSIEVFPN
tara:strand:- start:10149 stop:10652 length:504 start_codon:yes stop_codon:yes gene_type:complete